MRVSSRVSSFYLRLHRRLLGPAWHICLQAALLLAVAQPASAQLASIETRDLRLIFFKGTEEYLAPHAARAFENSMAFQSNLFKYQPSEKVTVLLDDFSDSGNAGASVMPRNNLSVQIAPLNFAYETISANERLNTIMNHELVHIAANDQAAHRDRFFRVLFRGKVIPTAEQPEGILYFYLTAPRVAAPRWYHEGIAVFIDTWMAGGLGRAQGAYDEMVFRSMVRDGSRFYDPLGLASEGTKVDFQVEANSYLYGTRFMSYLANRWSPGSVVGWVARRDGSKAYYASQFRKVFGLPLEKAWHDWVDWEKEFQRNNLAAIRKHPATPYSDISARALGSVSRAYYDAGTEKIYTAAYYPGDVAHVVAISMKDGALEELKEIKEPVIYSVSSMAYDPGSKTIFYTADNNAYRDLIALDPTTKKAKTLLKDARIGELAFDQADRSIWGVRTYNGISSLVRVPYPYKDWNTLHSFPYGEVAYDLDVSPDGQLLSASVGQIDGAQTLRIMSVAKLAAGDPEPIAKFDFGSAAPSNFVFSPDGKYLYGSSYFTGVSNIYRYEIATGKLEALSNSETGFFRPIPRQDGLLILFRYTGEGFVPATIEAKPVDDLGAITFFGAQVIEKHPELKDWNVGSPLKVPLESLITRTGSYSSIRGIRLESAYPVVSGYKDSAALGYRLNLSDPLSLSHLNLTASHSLGSGLPANERIHAQMEFRRYDWRASARYNGSDFYDLFGPTKTSRKGYALGLGYDKTLLYDEPRKMGLSFDGTYYGNLDRLPGYQNVAVSFKSLFTAQAKFRYSNVRSSLGHVDDEKGEVLQVVLENDYASGKAVPRIHSDNDLGFALPLGHSSLWLRSSAGLAFGDRQDPIANFYFGGFGNNWVDHGPEKRYREYYSFPGVQLNDIAGKNYAKTTIEWNLPPVRFSRAGTPGFYLSWVRPAVFAGGLMTNLDNAFFRRTVEDVGSQLDLRFSLLSRLDMTLSAGYAHALGNSQQKHDEFMLSLKILN